RTRRSAALHPAPSTRRPKGRTSGGNATRSRAVRRRAASRKSFPTPACRHLPLIWPDSRISGGRRVYLNARNMAAPSGMSGKQEQLCRVEAAAEHLLHEGGPVLPRLGARSFSPRVL